MALILDLKNIESLQGKAERVVRITFRGNQQLSKITRSSHNVAYFGQRFEWPIARGIDVEDPEDVINIDVFNFNKYSKNKLIGKYTLLLQQLVQCAHLHISDPLVDNNNRILESVIQFEIRYFSPDGKIGDFEHEEFNYPLLDTGQEELDNISIGPPTALHETMSLRDPSKQRSGDDLVFTRSEEGQVGEDDIETASQTVMLEQLFIQSKRRPELLDQELHKPRDFQVCVTVIEGVQLAGLNIDPVIKVEVGDLVKYTNIKQSTNNPFFHEYFVFDFKESPAMIFDKMITISVVDAIALPGRQVYKAAKLVAGKTIGQFKCDIGTVYSAPDHQFYHKYALLLNPKDPTEGPRGYIKCDISVLGKGDVIKKSKRLKENEEDANNIEGNLLLPAGVPMERQMASFRVIIYRAEDLPRTDFGIMASVKKVLSQNPVAFVDAFVKVSFAGHIGKTTVKKSYNPEFRQVVNFIEMFPPLCNRIKVQICDHDMTSDDTIGTHFIELPQIMDPGGDTEGILPTFGPTWVNFYGSPRNYKFVGDHEDLDEGLGEGVAYKGRLLIALKTEILSTSEGGATKVITEKLRTSAKIDVAPRKKFLLFGTIFEANMIDRDLKDKEIHFELSIGQFGNYIDAKNVGNLVEDLGGSSDEEDHEETLLIKKKKEEEAGLPIHSCTENKKPETFDKNYYHLPYYEKKPVFWLSTIFEDLRKRIFHTNLLTMIYEKLNEGIDDVRQMVDHEFDDAHRRLKGVLDDFMRSCETYIKHSDGLGIGAGSGKTKLDKHRLKKCRNTVDKLKSKAKDLRRHTKRENVSQQFRETKIISKKLFFLLREPQQSIPDIVLWMIVDKKRHAYSRIPVKDIIQANIEEFTGKHCGKITTLFLKKPGKKAMGPSGWTMQGKVEMLLWFGIRDDGKKDEQYLKGLPEGYQMIEHFVNNNKVPTSLVYTEHHVFQFRAYLYQARALIGSDDSGLSDPFARVIIGNQCKQTVVINETLSPRFDQTLVFFDVIVYGPLEQIVSAPPLAIVEFFDHDRVGKPEYLGRCMVKPKVKIASMAYEEPEFPSKLEWFDVFRGPKAYGQLLASFELLQSSAIYGIPPLPDPRPGKDGKPTKEPVIPIPDNIKPSLNRYRLEVLHWGLRDVRRVQFLSVDSPRCDMEIAGKVITSGKIDNINRTANFPLSVQHIDLDLPDDFNYWPPLTVRVVDCRNFGRETLVGVCTIPHLSKYLYIDPQARRAIIQERQRRMTKVTINTLPSLQEGQELKLFDAASMMGSVNLSLSPSDGHGGNISIAGSIAPGNGRAPSIAPSNGRAPSIARSQILPPTDVRSGSTHGSVQFSNLNMPVTAGQGAGTNPNDVVINMDGTPGQMGVPGQTGLNGQVAVQMPPQDKVHKKKGFTPPPDSGNLSPADMKKLEKEEEAKKKRMKQRRELIAELDWWSKYYTTREDMAKAEYEQEIEDEKNGHKHREYSKIIHEGDGDTALDMNVVDYSDINEAGLAHLKKVADERRKKELEEEEKSKKKKKKKKKGKQKPKKSAKERMKDMKGNINKAFKKEEGDEDGADDEEEGGVDEDDMEDKSHIARIQVYPSELEEVEEFGGFKSFFETFFLHRGKKVNDEDDEDLERLHGKIKMNFMIYKLEDNEDISPVTTPTRKKKLETPKLKLLKDLPNPKPFEVQVLVYIIKAFDLHPVDFNGKADPYVSIRLGRSENVDKDNKKINQLNPIFGKLYEFNVVFPMDSILKVSIMDYDSLSADDLVGETIVDLENRIFSKHRPSCGIQNEYELYGYNIWRDPQKPTDILKKLCKDAKIAEPEYKMNNVRVAGNVFYGEHQVENEAGERLPTYEHLALEVLKNWEKIPGGFKLVPEHVETRPLYNPEKPGVEQGKLEMWIDMFPKDMPGPSVTVDITARQPKAFELRCIIWNTDEVVLEDTNMLTGEQSSDIFVRGYMKGRGEDDQQTDVHYRSLTGEGNFNWRFIFPFDYLKAEEKIVYQSRADVFDMDSSEIKIPPKLTLQVWDADLVSSDDFLGACTIDLNRIPKPAKDVKKCKLEMLKKDGSVPTLNLFKNKRCKGWWPMASRTEEGDLIKGKVEAELILMTKEEAEKTPAGLGREEPDSLPEPNRPDTSFLWILNPLKTFKMIFWKNFKWTLLKIFLILLALFFVGLFFYTMPEATVNKIWGNI